MGESAPPVGTSVQQDGSPTDDVSAEAAVAIWAVLLVVLLNFGILVGLVVAAIFGTAVLSVQAIVVFALLGSGAVWLLLAPSRIRRARWTG